MRSATFVAFLFLATTLISCGGQKAATQSSQDSYLVDARTIMDEFRKSYRRLFALTREPDFSVPWRGALADEVIRQRDLSQQFRALDPPAAYEAAHTKVEEALDTFDKSEALLLEAANERDMEKFAEAGRLASGGEHSLEEAGNLLARKP